MVTTDDRNDSFTPKHIVQNSKRCFCEIVGSDDTMRLQITKQQAQEIMNSLSSSISIMYLGDGDILLYV